ncbi:MAG TPA: alpha/beta fold hydrolase [Cytophagales bacterium]|nr:alpha/beta fold hydrolase [Cytophagales bacterium]
MLKIHKVVHFTIKMLIAALSIGMLQGQSTPPAEAVEQSLKKGNKKNTYLLVHGAWHPVESWDLLKKKLEKKGHTVKTVQLPGLGKDETPLAQITLETHIYAVKKALTQIEGKVILVGHSYGGVLISAVGEAMPEKIEKLVYLTAFMLKSGESLATIATQDTGAVVTKNLIFEGPAVSVPKEKYVEAFYNTILENNNKKVEAEVNRIISMLKPHPVATIATPITIGDNYAKLEKVYISCLKDQAITPWAQKLMYSRFPETKVYILNADHSPFLTQVNPLVHILTKL